MNKLITFVVLLFTTNLIAQTETYNTTSEIPSDYDIKAQHFPNDSTTNAFYVYESGFAQISDTDQDLNLKYVGKIKILNKEGLDHATVKIRIRGSEKIQNIQADTYYFENGEKIKKTLNTQNVYTEDNGFYDYVTFTFPDAKPGAVLVYSYELVSPYIYNFKTWYFQDVIPKLKSIYTTRIPANFEYHIVKNGELKLDKNESKVIKNCIDFGGFTSTADCLQSTYEIENIPAIKKEGYMTSIFNYLTRIEFELNQVTQLDGWVEKMAISWEDVDKRIKKLEGIGRQLRRNHAVKDLLPDEIENMTTGLKKAEAIYNFVQQNFTWDGGYGIYFDYDLHDIAKEKSGSIIQVNTILHNILDDQGFEVYPIIGNTRNSGFPNKLHPSLAGYNYMFVQLKLNDEEYFLDATEKNLDFGRLPFRALNQYARKFDFKNESSWINIDPQDFSIVSFQDSLKINKDGSSQGISRQLVTGYNAKFFRDELDKKKKNEAVRDFSKPQSHTTVTNIAISHQDDPAQNLIVTYNLHNKSQKIDDRVYYNPLNFKFFDKNPFTLDERDYPVDFGFKRSYTYSSIVEIPENYSVEEIPQSKVMRLPNNDGMLIFQAIQGSDNTVNIQYRLTINQNLYNPGYYNALKQFFNEILNVQNQSLIVLKENT